MSNQTRCPKLDFIFAGEVTGITPRRTGQRYPVCNIPVEDEDVFHEFYERCGRQLNVPLAAILNRMPFYRCRGGVRMMNSRRLLAHFLLQADRLFEAHDVRMEIETVASLAETMRQGRCVSSGVH